MKIFWKKLGGMARTGREEQPRGSTPRPASNGDEAGPNDGKIEKTDQDTGRSCPWKHLLDHLGGFAALGRLSTTWCFGGS